MIHVAHTPSSRSIDDVSFFFFLQRYEYGYDQDQDLFWKFYPIIQNCSINFCIGTGFPRIHLLSIYPFLSLE